MKIKHLLIGMLAVAAAVACKQDEPVETPKLDVDKEAVAVAAVAGEASFNVTSNQSWVASADQDWVSVNPASGDASEKAVAVKVTAEDNETTDARTATVTVKAGELTKTVKVTQAPGEGQEPGGDPLPNSEWALVGSFNGWDPTSTTYLCILDDQYFVYYGFELEATTEFKFLKGGSWSGTEIGGNGLVEPNTIQPKGGSNIKVSEAGIYDIYLAADLEHFYIMSEGKTPEEATEPAPVDDQWGMMGCFVNNMWASDVPMTKEGEWIVAKGAEFTELTFKIRANSSWADATNIGVAPGSERGVVNGKIAVVTAEYAKANLGGDAADIKLNGEAGTYDVYFSFENLEVYVMEQGFKPGEKDPQNPDPVEVTYTVVGTIENQNWNNSAPEGLMVAEGDYLVAKNVPFLMASTMYGGPEQFEFKIVETGTWTGYGRVEDVTNPVNAEVAVKLGGDNIMVAGTEGAYDVYFDKANAKVWVMAPGYKPGETPEPEPEYELDGKQWLLSASGMYVLVDLGLYEEDAMVIAIPLNDGSGFGAYMYGTYEIEKANNTSGKIVFTQYDPEWDEWMEPVDYAYSDLSDELVMINAEPITGYPDALPFVAVAEPYEIIFESAGGDPVGPIENGQYWFFNGTKVMAPLAEGVTTGTFPAGNVIDGASTEKNIFTLMYDPDMSYYTIMDSYGRYVGHTDWESGNLTVTDVLPTGDDYAYYLWCVDNSYADGTCDIYNAATYFGFAYSATENCWYADENSFDTDGIRPTLVVAENPVEEPVVPAFEPGEYFIMDGNGKVVVPIAESSTYGYWSVTAAVEDAGDYIGYAENVFTIEAVDGGYTIQDVYGRHHYMTTYNSFSVSTSTQSNGSHIWSITLQDDGSYAIVNNYTGKTVQFSSYGNYAPYTDVTGALPYLVKADKVAEKPQAPEEEVAEFETNVTCKTVSSAYTDGVATVNGVADVFTLKLGTSKLNGKATITLPAGTTEVTYYAVGWKGTSAKLQFSVGGTVAGTQSLAANTGATGNSPYTMTVSDSDHYTFTLGSALETDTEVTVETTGSAYRAILFGIQAK